MLSRSQLYLQPGLSVIEATAALLLRTATQDVPLDNFVDICVRVN